MRKFSLSIQIIFLLFIMPFSGMSQLSIISVSPSNNSEDISTSTQLIVNFTNKVFPGEGSIFIYTNGTEIMQIYSDDACVDYDSEKIIIDIPKSLEEETEYLIYIDDDAFTNQQGTYIKDFGPALNWSFTTKKRKKSLYLHSYQEPSFYPNPATTNIYLKNTEDVEFLHISNLTGRNIIEVATPNSQISLSTLPKGMYFVTFILKNNKRISRKLIKR